MGSLLDWTAPERPYYVSEDKWDKVRIAIHAAGVSAAAAASGLAQIPCSDSTILLPIQVGLAVTICGIFGVEVSRGVVKGVIYSNVMKMIGRKVTQVLFGWVPGLGNAINASTAGILTEVLGWDIAKRAARTEAYPTRIRLDGSPKYGDVICVRRNLGVDYCHYGIYEADDAVYAYSGEISDLFGGDVVVRKMTLDEFMDGDDELFSVNFPQKLVVDVSSDASAYRLRTPEETVAAAREALGTADYSLLDNNCEHFSVWCKTGVRISFQIEQLF